LGYQPTYWQYMDKLVYWAGSASEGIIIPPPAGSIDAAHQSGVKVLGQIFFPPRYYGGNQEWIHEMLSQENGKYIYAIKLYEIAKYLGFDGWFINEETGGGSAYEWEAFIKEFNREADAHGDTQMEIQWYNASHSPNTLLLKSHKNTSQFIEYGSVGDFRNYAEAIGCTKEETFSKIYGGIQCVNGGLMGYGRTLREAFPTSGHVGSVDLFCPEERVWKDNVKDLLNTDKDNGPLAYSAIERTFFNEDMMWVNKQSDPSKIADDGSYYSWPGISGCVLERSVISQIPFMTSFCVGVGKYRFVNGEKRNVQDWYHSGVQSIMPTWRWWIENKGNLSVKINWEDAYNFGNSIKIYGKLSTGDHLMRLYKTMIPITDGGKLRLVYKTSNKGSVQIKLATESNVNGSMITLDAPVSTENNRWTIDEYDLSSLKGKTIYMVSLNMKTDVEVAGYYLNLGGLAILPANYQPEALVVENLANETKLAEEQGDLRLTWDWENNVDFDHFDIYTTTSAGDRKLVGQTRGEGFYVPNFIRYKNDPSINVSLIPIMKDGTEGPVSKLTVDYPKMTTPVVTVTPNKSYAKVGEEITLKAKGTMRPFGWKWILPETLELVEGSSLDKEMITVRAKAEGRQFVTIESTNEVGTSATKVCAFDILSEADYGNIKNIALNKKVQSYSGSTNERETPAKIIDGTVYPNNVSDKWCNINSTHECIIDLQGDYRIYGFKIFDCKSGPENNENFDKYRIYLSDDGENWKLVVNEKGRYRDNIKNDNITPMAARYVKLNPYSDEGMTLRIWEFEVFGVNNSNMTITANDAKINTGATQNIIVKYDLNGDERVEPFKCIAETANNNVTIGEITEDKEAKTFIIPITAGKEIGVADIKVMLHNGVSYKEKTIKVVIDNPNAENILKGIKAEVRQYETDYSYGVAYKKMETSELTDGNTSKNAFAEAEEYCTHKQDFWTVFTADSNWKLSKVKIMLADNNKGVNFNENSGIVNNTIEIWLSDDNKVWKSVKTFENLGEVTELEYIFPEYKSTKYLAVVSTLNPYFYPSIAEIEAYEQNTAAVSKIVPVEIKSGWNQDVIVEATPADIHSTSGLDKEGWAFYTKAIQEEGAIAGDDRILTTKSGKYYKFADYAQNNALVLNDVFNTHMVEFAQPEIAEELYVLYMGANGNTNLSIIPVYEDGTEETEWLMPVEDWYGYETDRVAYYGLSRIMRNSDEESGYELDETDFRSEFRLFEYVYPVDKNKKVKGVKFKNTSYSCIPSILAISKLGPESTPTAIKQIGNTKTGKQDVVGIYTINGTKLNTFVKGINIIKYANGSVKKVLIK